MTITMRNRYRVTEIISPKSVQVSDLGVVVGDILLFETAPTGGHYRDTIRVQNERTLHSKIFEAGRINTVFLTPGGRHGKIMKVEEVRDEEPATEVVEDGLF